MHGAKAGIKRNELADRLLETLRKKPGQRVKHNSLARRLSASEAEIARAAECLLEWGYIIRGGPGWYEFKRAPDALLDTEITFGLRTKTLGQQVHAYRKVKSTIPIATSLANAGAPEGTLVIAEEQSAGRGRLGRPWHSPPGVGAYLSLILRPKVAAADTPALSIVAAIALAEAVEKQTALAAQVKWPNDVLVHGRKVAGILTGMSADGTRVCHVIVSAGLNINQMRGDFPPELFAKAASLRMLARRKVDRAALVREFLEILERRYTTFVRSGFSPLRKKARSLSALLGRRISITGAAASGVSGAAGAAGAPGAPEARWSKAKTIRGEVIDIDDYGRLLVNTGADIVALIAGEVTLEGNYP